MGWPRVAPPLRFINVAFGAWLIAAPWLLAGETLGAAAASVIAGLVLVGLSLPRGPRTSEHHGAWDKYVFLIDLRHF
jgi:hypothetical protein